MKLEILGSSSSGNCYLFKEGESVLILECGIPFNKVKKALKWDISKVIGAFVSHEHGDHAKYIRQFTDSCIPVYASKGTLEAIGIESHNAISFESMSKIRINEWTICAFGTDHDSADPLGFIIEHPESGPILFLTDATSLKYKFPMRFSHILIEANYSHEIMQERILNGSFTVAQEERVKASHMSIDNACKILRNLDSVDLRNVVLIHLSDGNSNAEIFKKAAQEATPYCCVEIAEQDLEIEINKNPF